jgi:sec-independent protein translocase protein TatB
MDILGIGIGLPQLVLILLVAMLVFGPERLPEIARQIAKWVNVLRSYANDVQGQFGGELDDIRSEVFSIQRDLSSVQTNLRQGIGDLDQSIRSVTNEVQTGVAAPLRSMPATLNGTTGMAEPDVDSAVLPDYAPPTPRVARPVLHALPDPEPELALDGRVPDYRPPS